MSTEEKIKYLFDKYDENKNGVLEKSELLEGFNDLLLALDDTMSQEKIEKIAEEAIRNFDLNNNGTIELDEFTDIIHFLVTEKGLKI